MKILFCMILCGFPLLASGQCLLEKLYALTGTLRQEMWAQKGVAGHARQFGLGNTRLEA